MQRWHFFILLMMAALSGCAQDHYYQPTTNTASSPSGITVYGEIDASVGHTR